MKLALLLALRFQDVATEAGLRFILENGATPQKRMIETMPGGIAVFDYDNDGLPDIYFTNGASVPSLRKDAPKYWNRLFHNEGRMRFRDVTEAAGVAGEGYSMGAAVGDFDNDGFVDLFVAGVNRNILFRNLGNGRFSDVTARAGIRNNEWGVAGGWFDYDNDGRLDLIVVNYGRWEADQNRFCGDESRKLRVYCHPKYFDPRPNQLYRNRGDGTFEDMTQSSGIGAHAGRGMSVAFADYDSDGLMDAFLTNDNLPNFLFRNLGNGKFEETALLAGAALLDHGKPIASMGADFRDYDNDGYPDINVTALNGETFPVFRNDGKGGFRDATYASGVAGLSTGYSGWGNGWVDFNNDGWKDLFTANSHVNDVVEKFEAAVYKQPNAVFVNLGKGKFAAVPNAGLERAAKAHRGAAFADFDSDGRVDVVVTALGEPAELWKNVTPAAGPWLGVQLIGRSIGARVRIGDQVQWMTTAVSYASSAHVPLHFGSPKGPVEIRWPSGKTQIVEPEGFDRVLKIVEP
ncbi:MAG: CRTAC1 family protein [Bryobacteraceae bacterium]|nr:CRTAC1 family protein [Bryobacteraceae bacterium]